MTCAYAVRGALMKFAGVEAADVSLNKGLASVKLKPGNKVTMPELWETVRKNGFTPKETRMVARGAVLTTGKLQLEVSGTSQVYDLIADQKTPAAVEEARRQAGKTVIVEGILAAPKGEKPPLPMRVTGITTEVRKGK